ncbi:polysaccharide deacetylase [Solidesulfovibrio fructosivorans JJ]]|uniref:Polysaccharide deacetylase n=1 Tax=Solidesulfovibrio fructosivorans JJ] TaxID=596151 RepID=E1JWC0_SOLFR|nr:polysaccharide deacetylase family protein [Solidesulfovibrio fructosivorans]EFL51217.1 polysaccharide deacetylase [Solidesulfovibrio fructosivorans JJ]]
MRFARILALTFCLPFLAGVVTARAAGSAAVFTALWSPDVLAAGPGERKSGRLGPPDRSPPEATTFPALPPLPEALAGSIRRVNTHGEKLVALTFDLCELADQKSGYDGAVVDALRAAGAKATFFAGGKWMRSHPTRAMQLISDPLFEIGSHAWTHGNFGQLDTAEMRRQIAWTQAEYALLREKIALMAREKGISEAAIATIPAAPTLLRFPYGRCRPDALSLVASMGLAAIQWSLTTGDPDPHSTPERIVKIVLARVRPGDILIGHANGNGHGTGEALPRLLVELRKRGYRFVTVSELLAAGRPLIASDCYDFHPGDTAQYDRIFGDGTIHPRHKKGPRPQPRPEHPGQ